MFSRKFRFSVTRKIAAGLALIIVIGMVSMLFIYRGLVRVEQALQRLADVQAPINAAAYEMELNVNGAGLAVLKYLATRRPEYRSWAEKDARDFAQYYDTYLRLVGSDRERSLARSVGALHAEFTTLARNLMSLADRQETLYTSIASDLEDFDHVIDARLQPALFSQVAGGTERFGAAVATTDLEAEAAEVGFWVANYHREPTSEARRIIAAKLRALDRTLGTLRAFPLSGREQRHSDALQRRVRAIGTAVAEVLSLEDKIHAGRERLIELRRSMDQVLDDEIQVLALRGLDLPRRDAKAAADAVLHAMRYLVPLYVLAACVIGALLVYVIRVPLARLNRGTRAIARGDLTHRIAPFANDEFGDLADLYNRMVVQLQETTVSRDRLEESEARLRLAVADLEHEIRERERAEQARERVQAELRRSETMSAMGVLVAGVAHEVRNPLFGISSTLDAMEARLGAQSEQQRYLAVLRTEVNRLSRLMRDLLSYGKPPAREFTVAPANAVVALATKACESAARDMSVTLVNRAEEATGLIRVEQGRFVQALQNVLDNALQHAPPQSAVTIEARETQENERVWMDFVVKDRGPGFEAMDLPRLFEPFFTRRRGGTGLGLALVQRIVQEHGGHVLADNRPDGGAVVTLRLPLVEARPSGEPKEIA
jgi:signal transduction histidine kinase